MPLPYGGKRAPDHGRSRSEGAPRDTASRHDVVNAINAQNLILPTGTAKIGTREYSVQLNSSPDTVEALNDLPIRAVNGATIYIRDVAHVRDGFAVQTNIVRARRPARQPAHHPQKRQRLDARHGRRREGRAAADPGARCRQSSRSTLLFDQSLFVRAADRRAWCTRRDRRVLTALMILLFLGSWRSTLIVAISIPLSILTSIIMLSLLGHTLNVMTLGGLALAVGILVDDATVEIENIHRNLAHGQAACRAILDGAQQIAVPAFVSTLCDLHRVRAGGVPRPAGAVTCSRRWRWPSCSRCWRRTCCRARWCPTMVQYLLAASRTRDDTRRARRRQIRSARIHARVRAAASSGCAQRYRGVLDWALAHRRAGASRVFGWSLLVSAVCCCRSSATTSSRRSTPASSACTCARPPARGIEETERLFTRVEAAIRAHHPAERDRD